MCNNNGHCRKFDAGVMCPSYRVTRDEQHTTRGRANTLRLALSGQLGDEDLGGDAVHAALDLCVSCKACRRECPTGVDMAKMKIESLAAYNQRHGVALRDRLIAHLPRYAPMVSRVAWLANLLTRLPGAAQLAESWLGLSARRAAAGVAAAASCAASTVGRRRTGSRCTDARSCSSSTRSAITSRTRSRPTRAACSRPPATRCTPTRCRANGRCAADEPFSPRAWSTRRRPRRGARWRRWSPYARRGVAIVGLEPSCLLGMRDEFLNYGLGEDAALVARHAMLFEEFLVRERAAGRLTLPLKPLPQGEALLHGHCHQKAFAAMTPIADGARLDPGPGRRRRSRRVAAAWPARSATRRSITTLSMQMAEQALLPAVRAASAATLIVADGFSCRHQIRDGAGRDAMHVASVLAMALA